MDLPGRGLASHGHEQIAFAPSHVKRKGGSGIELAERLVELLAGLDVGRLSLAGDRRDDVARAHVGAPAVAHLLHDHPPVDLQVALLLRGEVGHDETEPVGRHFCRRAFSLVAAARDAVLGQLPDRDRDLLRRALAPQLDARLAYALSTAHDARQLVRARDGLAVELHDDVARLDARLLRRPALLDRVHERAGGFRQAERLGELLGHFLYHDADPAPAHAAVLPQLALDLH